jgi:hypothetical protein
MHRRCHPVATSFSGHVIPTDMHLQTCATPTVVVSCLKRTMLVTVTATPVLQHRHLQQRLSAYLMLMEPATEAGTSRTAATGVHLQLCTQVTAIVIFDVNRSLPFKCSRN